MKRIAIILSMLALSAAYLFADYTDHRNRHVDSLEVVLQTNNHLSDDDRVRMYKDMMWGYLQTDGKRSAYYAQQVVELSRRYGYLNSENDGLRILGLVSYGAGDYESALDYFNQALAVTERMRNNKHYKESDIDDNLSALYGSIGNLYNMQDKLHLAISYYKKALSIFEKYDWKESTAILYYNVAELYASMGNRTEAELNYRKSLHWALLSADGGLIALPNKGLALFYIASATYDSASAYLPYAYDYYSAHRDEENEAFIECLVAKGRIALNRDKNISLASDFAAEALGRISNNTAFEQVASVYMLMCEVAMSKKDWQQALRFALLSVEADGGDTYSDVGLYVWMAQIYVELGDSQKAKDYIVKVHNMMAEFATLHYQSGLSQMEVLYETEKKQLQIEQLEAQRRGILIFSIMAAVILLSLILIFFFLWRSMRLQRRNAVVQAKLEGELAERVRISRDLHDRLGGLLTALRLTLSAGSEPQRLTDEAIREMRNVSHHLLPDSLRRYGLRTALADYCAVLKTVTFEYRGEKVRLEHEDAIYCIVYELVNNAVKSAAAKKIYVLLEQSDGTLHICISDDGKGFSKDEVNVGAGLANVRERVAALKGVMQIDSQENKGTTINILINVKQI